MCNAVIQTSCLLLKMPQGQVYNKFSAIFAFSKHLSMPEVVLDANALCTSKLKVGVMEAANKSGTWKKRSFSILNFRRSQKLG